jgi:hypothetical protein
MNGFCLLTGRSSVLLGRCWHSRLTAEPARDASIPPNLHVLNSDGFQAVGTAEAQSQGGNGRVKLLDGMQGLGVHGGLEVAKELGNTRERRPWLKRPAQESLFLAYDSYLTKLVLGSIDQIHGGLGTELHS